MNHFILPGILGILLLASCQSDKHEKKVENVRFLVTSPQLKDTIVTRDYVCQIHAIQHIELRALERGYLQDIYVDEGQKVGQGQLMFQIMPLLYQAETQKAAAEAEFAKIEYNNIKSLADSNIVSKNELKMARARYDKALAELQLAQVHLGFTQIKAPFDGIMDRFHVRKGSLLEEGELLTTLSDNSKMWVYFNVPESEYLDYMSKLETDSLLRVSLIMANEKAFKYRGVVETIEADFNNQTGNIAFRATFPNPERLLRHGETGNVRVASRLENALLIPQKATFEILDKQYVYVIDKKGVVHSRIIKIEAELPHLYAIKSGLKPGDKILLEGLRKVKENQKIKYEYIRPDEVNSHLDLYAE